MRLPAVHSSISAVKSPPPGAPPTFIPSAGVPFAVHWQIQTEWCWVAVAESLSNFFATSPPQSQCVLAAGPLKMDCCDLVNKAASNQPGSLKRALQMVGHFATVLAGSPTFAHVEAELNAGRPLAARFMWGPPATGAHFVTLVGCGRDASGVEMLEIQDPQYGYTCEPLAGLQTLYRQNSIQWTHTYMTTP